MAFLLQDRLISNKIDMQMKHRYVGFDWGRNEA